jgi:hypothetical protein
MLHAFELPPIQERLPVEPLVLAPGAGYAFPEGGRHAEGSYDRSSDDIIVWFENVHGKGGLGKTSNERDDQPRVLGRAPAVIRGRPGTLISNPSASRRGRRN